MHRHIHTLPRRTSQGGRGVDSYTDTPPCKTHTARVWRTSQGGRDVVDTYRYREVVCVYIHERRISRGERAVCVQMITNLEAYQGFAGPNEWYMLAINDMYIMGVYFTAQCTYRVHLV